MPVVVSSEGATAVDQTGRHVVTGIVTESRFFRLRGPVCVSERQEADLWVHECKLLDILAYAKTRKESWRLFACQFEATWEWIAQEDDAKLDQDARALKQKYLDVVEAVESVL